MEAGSKMTKLFKKATKLFPPKSDNILIILSSENVLTKIFQTGFFFCQKVEKIFPEFFTCENIWSFFVPRSILLMTVPMSSAIFANDL